MTTHSCPLCDSNYAMLIDSVAISVLQDAYSLEWLGADINRLFESDHTGFVQLMLCRNCDLRWFADAPVGDEAFYERLQAHEWYYPTAKPEFVYAASRVPVNARVLEVGCGSGAFTSFLRSNVRYRGLEFNDAAVAKARLLGLDVDKASLAEHVRGNHEAYDVVCHFQVLEHVCDPKAFLWESAAALRPGGRLIVGVPSEDSFVGLAESCWLNMPPHHLTRWSDASLTNAVHRLNLKVEDIWHEPVSDYCRDLHTRVMASAGIRSIFGSRPRLISSRTLERVRYILCALAAVQRHLVARGLKAFPQAVRGPTVCVVARKP
jgi:SAM-dependent methyltransferase